MWPIDGHITRMVGHMLKEELSPDNGELVDHDKNKAPEVNLEDFLPISHGTRLSASALINYRSNSAVNLDISRSNSLKFPEIVIKPPLRISTPLETTFKRMNLMHNLDEISSTPNNVDDELLYIQYLFPSIFIEKRDGQCIISLHTSDPIMASATIPSAFLRIHVSFPPTYPSESPTFELEKTGMMSMVNRAYISKRLSAISAQCAAKSELCLETCVRFLLGEPVEPSASISIPNMNIIQPPETKLLFGSLSDVSARSSELESRSPNSKSYSDSSSSEEIGLGSEINVLKRHAGNNVPFPCLCGARFSMNGALVYFQSPIPHPTTSKFSSLVPSNRRTLPVLQAQHLQPKAYPSYERYRSFLLSKYPRKTLSNPNVNMHGDRFLNFFDEDDDDDTDEDTEPIVSNYILCGSKPEEFSMSNFLLLLFERKRDGNNPATKSFIEGRRLSINKIRRKYSVSSLSSANIISSSELEWRDDLNSQLQRKSSPDMFLSSMDDDIKLSLIKRTLNETDDSGMHRISSPQRIGFSVNDFNSKLAVHEEFLENGYGAVVNIMEVSHLLPINQSLAEAFT